MRKLYVVEIAKVLVIEAVNQKAATELAIQHHSDDAGRYEVNYCYAPTPVIDHIPRVWRDAIPWGGDGEKTCREILCEVDVNE